MIKVDTSNSYLKVVDKATKEEVDYTITWIIANDVESNIGNSLPISQLQNDYCYAVVRKDSNAFPYYLYWNKLSLNSGFGNVIS
jgi:hypothetical protein